MERFSRGQVEVDLLTHLGAGVYDGLATDHPTTVLSDTGAGSVTSQALKTATSVFDSRAVVNRAVGGRTKYFTTNFDVANLGFVYFLALLF